MFAPNLAQQTFPDAPQKLDGMTVIGVTGDRAFLTRLDALPGGQVIFGAQLYDCAITIALAASAARSADPTVYGPKMNTVLSGSRPCSTYGDCLAKLSAGETIAYQGQIGSFTFSRPHPDRDSLHDRQPGQRQLRRRQVDRPRSHRDRHRAGRRAGDGPGGPDDPHPAGAHRTRAVQRADRRHPSDELTAAIIALQAQLGVPQTGVWDEATDTAAQAKLGTASLSVSEATKSIQRALTDLGFYTGPIDGRMSAETVAAMRALQADLGVPQTGVIDAATLKAIYDRGIASVPVPGADHDDDRGTDHHRGADHDQGTDHRPAPTTTEGADDDRQHRPPQRRRRSRPP